MGHLSVESLALRLESILALAQGPLLDLGKILNFEVRAVLSTRIGSSAY